MISEALAAAGASALTAYEPSGEVQFLLMVIQALWAIILVIVSVILGMVLRSIREAHKLYQELHDRVLTEFATKKEVIERSHGLRDALGVHSTWIHLLAMKLDLHLPSRKDGDSV